MHKTPSPDDLRVFAVVVRKASFAEAARELGASPAFVSKRIRLLEEDLAVKLLHPPRAVWRSRKRASACSIGRCVSSTTWTSSCRRWRSPAASRVAFCA